MTETIEFLVRHGYILLFVWTLAEQIGLPVPGAEPLLIAAGALARAGRLSLGLTLGIAIVACLISDGLWYYIGRRQGIKVLKFLCRISLEPDSCVRQMQNVYARHGVRSLVIAKFVPGLSTAAPPLAGVLAMSRPRFLLFDGLGSLIWAGAFAGLGYLFSNQLEPIGEFALSIGWWLMVLLAGGLAAYLIFKYVNRQRFLRRLAVARITPDELKEKLDAGQDILVVDLRHMLDFTADPSTIPHAIHIADEELDRRYQEIPRDREIVLYCT